MPWYKASWGQLDSYVTQLKRRTKNRNIWSCIDNNPLNYEAIDALVKDGCRVRIVSGENYSAIVLLNLKLILLSDGLVSYERDKALLHELVHLWYGNLLDNEKRISWYDNDAITEWLARRARANPEILARAVHGFNLVHYIYDLASAQAFHGPYPVDFTRQLAFPFAEEDFERFRHTLMD